MNEIQKMKMALLVMNHAEGKMKEGTMLIRYFSVPDRNGKRHMPKDAPEKWDTFKRYNIHDEIIVEATQGQTLDQVKELFSRPIDWAPGLPLRGDGYTTPYYLKD